MLANFFGWLWIALGVIIVIKPQFLKNRMVKKNIRKIRKYFFLLGIILGGILIKVGLGFQGIIAKILMILGIIGVFKALLLVNAKTAEKLVEISEKFPLSLYRVGGIFYITIGITILMLAK